MSAEQSFEERINNYMNLTDLTFDGIYNHLKSLYPHRLDVLTVSISHNYLTAKDDIFSRLEPLKLFISEDDIITTVTDIKYQLIWKVKKHMGQHAVYELNDLLSRELKIQEDNDQKHAQALHQQFQQESLSRDEEELKNHMKLKLSEVMREITCCAICLENYADDDELIILHCRHAYHSNCYKLWGKNSCPQCRR